MNIKTKMILCSPWLGLRILGILRTARNSKNNPSVFTVQKRVDYLVKRAKWLLKFLKIELVVKGYDKLPKHGAILYPNHVSNIDAIAIMAAMDKQTKDVNVDNLRPTFLAKQELQDKYLTRKTLSIIDTFYLNRENIRESVKTLESFGHFVRDQRTLGVIFPEGTRARDDKLLEFKAGAFKVVKSNSFAVVPVTINGSGIALDPKRRKKITIEVIFHDAIDTLKINQAETSQIANLVKQKVQSEYQNQEVYNSKKQPKKRNPKKLTYSQKQAKKEAKLQEKARKLEDF
ncbi:lysophospholipid acyltransferase family protein [Mycoplasma sp. 3341]|uniref:lysophospholipid acyltransferase family protein n=1 Tax=Mycoplasma sp. 3341 TaxID=3447506 RepID=UPI003F65E153